MSDRYAVIGNPIEHSKSPQIHTAFAAQTGQQMEYGRILGEPGRFADQTRDFFAQGGRGLNVTVPFKEDAWRLADLHSPRAQSSGAANVLSLLPNGRTLADNTDGVGLVRDLRDNHGVALQGKRILLLGAGGAARGVARFLLETAPERLVIANRTTAKALDLAQELAELGPVSGCGLDALAGQIHDIIINATAASLSGQVPAIPGDCLDPGGVIYDMMYADAPTAFMRWGWVHGASIALDGLGMLVEQAAEAFFLWRGVRPRTMEVIEMLRGG